MVTKNQQLMTVDEFLQMENDDNINELINGIVLMNPRPSEEHMIILTNIASEIYMSLKNASSKCRSISENELRLDDKTYLIPDVMVKCKDPENELPTIVIEVLSPGSMKTDLLLKLNKYLECGIPEYWIVDPKGKTINVHNFKSETATKFYLNENEVVVSDILKELKIPLKDIFIV